MGSRSDCPGRCRKSPDDVPFFHISTIIELWKKCKSDRRPWPKPKNSRQGRDHLEQHVGAHLDFAALGFRGVPARRDSIVEMVVRFVRK